MCWIKPQETLGEYANVPGARGEVVVSPGAVKRPAGLAAGEDHLYVADNATGQIHAFEWDGMRPGPVLETERTGLSGLALDPSDEGRLYFTDTASDSVGSIAVD